MNANFIQLEGDISNLEPEYYPDKAQMILPPFRHDKFPPPQDVWAEPDEDGQVIVSWDGYSLEPGDRENKNMPTEYLVEVWTCQEGKIVFTPIIISIKKDRERMTAGPIRDEAGCDEPSHGRVYLEHRDGYIGPVEIPWPK